MKIEVRSRHTVNQWNSDGDVAIISITDPDCNHPFFAEKPELKEVLRLSFHDVEEELSDFKIKLMSDEDGKLVADFIEKHKEVDLLIVQCDAGICRSSGMAAAILKHLTGDDTQIFGDRRFIPNTWVNKKTREALNSLDGETADAHDSESCIR